MPGRIKRHIDEETASKDLSGNVYIVTGTMSLSIRPR